MYKAIVVDDEKMIRNGICNMIPWGKLGITRLFTASSGLEAVRVIKQKNPDIMLTDLCMAEMDGLTLIERVNAINPDIRVIVLTGYDNFEYVQKCCRMQVQDFILKPADEKELIEALKKQVHLLDAKRSVQQRQKIMTRAQGIAEQMKLEHAMRNLLYGRVRSAELQPFFEEYHYDREQIMQVAIILPVIDKADAWRGHNDLLNLSVKHMCIERFDSVNQGITFEDDEGRIIIAIFCSSDFDEIVERMEQLKNLLQDEFDVCPKVILGSVINGFGEMRISYNDALYLLNSSDKQYLDIIQPKRSEQRLRMFSDTLQELKKIMMNHIGDPDKLMKAYITFERSTQAYNLSHSFVRRSCFDIASSLYLSYIGDTGKSVDNRLTSLLNSLLISTGEEACRITRDFITQLLNQEEKNTHELVSEAKRYIEEHLADDLSISDIAAKLYITPNYFSRLFKKVTCEGCNEYIVRKRIEKAKSLLETTSIKTGKIALMVGYHDTNYFSLAFKKHTGMSPTDYRDNSRKAK